MLHLVRHYNLIQNHINDSLENDQLSKSREVYCRQLHIVKEPDRTDCVNCPYYGGLMQGYGHECVWDDVVNDHEIAISHSNRFKELLRVSQLIDRGILTK